MYIRLLQIREFSDVGRYLDPISRIERSLGRFTELRGRSFGSVIAPHVLEQSAAASVELSGLGAETDQAKALALGVADTLRVVMAHGGDLPFTESQIKYVHSLLLRHDPDAGAIRRKYRTDAPPPTDLTLDSAPQAASVPDEMAKLVAWTRAQLETNELHPVLVIGVFLYRFLVIRPFADANGRLARILAVFLLDICGYTFVQNVSLDALVVERRPECAAALAASGGDRADATAWLQFFLELVAELGRRAIDSIDTPPRRFQAAVPAPVEPAPAPVAVVNSVRLSPRQARLLEVMRERRAAKIGDLLPILETPRATLKKDLRGLVDAGLLVAEGVRKGTVYHVASEGPPLARADRMPV